MDTPGCSLLLFVKLGSPWALHRPSLQREEMTTVEPLTWNWTQCLHKQKAITTETTMEKPFGASCQELPTKQTQLFVTVIYDSTQGRTDKIKTITLSGWMREVFVSWVTWMSTYSDMKPSAHQETTLYDLSILWIYFFHGKVRLNWNGSRAKRNNDLRIARSVPSGMRTTDAKAMRLHSMNSKLFVKATPSS